jgi:predicted metalloprotease with PDZ domain
VAPTGASGTVVTFVEAGGPAERAGVCVGCRLARVNGASVLDSPSASAQEVLVAALKRMGDAQPLRVVFKLAEVV